MLDPIKDPLLIDLADGVQTSPVAEPKKWGITGTIPKLGPNNPQDYRPPSGTIPTKPGVYRFIDDYERVIYVGKAKNLRSRLSSYFQNLSRLHPRTQKMVTTASKVQWTVVNSDLEALTLEYTWIKEFDPRFNILFRDDKSYPSLVLTMAEPIPRVMITRSERIKGAATFGPYAHTWAIKDTLEQLLKVFPMRTCNQGVFKRAQLSNRPCLLGFIDKCSAPCVGEISQKDHRKLADGIIDFMRGNTQSYLKDLTEKMNLAAEELEYEQAAVFRDQILALEKLMEKNSIVLSSSTDADMVALEVDELEAAVHVFHVRRGIIRGERGWVGQLQDDSTEAELMERALGELYAIKQALEDKPSELLLTHLPTNPNTIAQLLGRDDIPMRVPKRGEKKELLNTALNNAKETLRQGKLKRAGDLAARSKALEDLAEAIGLSQAPLRIECFDISHSSGTNVVGSMVVFEDAVAKKSQYRRFSISGTAARDDTASMYDVIFRRLKYHVENKEITEGLTGSASSKIAQNNANVPRKFAYPPQLIVVDGGKPQVSAAQRAMDELGVSDVALIGLAKRLEEVWLPNEDFPLILPRNSEALFLLQRLRDEAHRFAITFHRTKRGRTMQESALDSIPGLGKVRKNALLDKFVTVEAISKASMAEIMQITGIGEVLAQTIKSALESEIKEPAVNMTTGEIIE